MGWSDEVHTNRLTEASLHAKRRARLQRANKLPEAEGSASSPVLLTAAGAILTAILLRQDGNQKQLKRAARNILDHIANLLPQTPTRGRTTGRATGTSSPRDKTATATTSGRPALPATSQVQQAQGQAQSKSKKKRKHRHR